MSRNYRTATTPGAFQIDGGATRGGNLFHSFSQFSVPSKGVAYFNNASDIQNIISRVTGSSISNIDGLIKTNGAANVFLINPNGIIFGPNASLNIGGSFVASTASSLKFADGTEFSATAHPTAPLLTINVPLGLQFGSTAGEIRVQGPGAVRDPNSTLLLNREAGLKVLPEATLALVGSNVVLEGGILTTDGGRIELSSVAGPSLISLTPIDKGWFLGYKGVQNFRDIKLSQQAAVDASGAGGGDIQVQGRRVTLTDGSRIEASTLGSKPGGTLAVNASDSVEVIGTLADGLFPSALGAQVYAEATGAGGDLTVKTGQLIVRDGAQVGTGTFDQGHAGNLSVSASDSVELIGGAAYGSSGLFTQTQGAGDAGKLTVETEQLSVQDGARVSALTYGQGNGGNIQINATKSVNISGVFSNGFSGGLFTSTNNLVLGVGQAGNITVNSRSFRVANGAVVSAKNRDAQNGGNITVNANTFEADNGGQVLSTTFGSKSAGNIILNVSNSVTLSESDRTKTTQLARVGKNVFINKGSLVSGLFANTDANSTGKGGTISIDSTKLTLTDGASVAVNSLGKGNAGNLQIQSGAVTLDGGSFITAATASGEGGMINLQAPDLLLMRHGSQISATAQGTANGGNININTPFIVAVPSENSDIIATAINGRGGNIGINASSIFGIQRNDQDTSQSYISASSQLGINGTVQINTLPIDRSFGLVSLPTNLVDTSGLITNSCIARGRQQRGRFIITGAGGLPTRPDDAEASPFETYVVPNLHSPGAGSSNKSSVSSTAPAPARNLSESAPIVEAQGWVFGSNGEVILTAQPNTFTPHNSWSTPPTCNGL